MSEPYCLALVLCDAVHRDPATGKCTILGTFSTVNSLEFPTHLSFCQYNAVTDADGEFKLKFQIVDSGHSFEEDAKPLFSVEVDLHSPSPLAVIEGTMAIQNVPLPKPGVYHCELLHEETLLMSRRLVAIQMSGVNEEGEGNVDDG